MRKSEDVETHLCFISTLYSECPGLHFWKVSWAKLIVQTIGGSGSTMLLGNAALVQYLHTSPWASRKWEHDSQKRLVCAPVTWASWIKSVCVWCQLVTAVPATAMPPCQEQSDWERRKWREKKKNRPVLHSAEEPSTIKNWDNALVPPCVHISQ